MRKLAVLASLSMTVLAAGCFDDPQDAGTWIKKLDDVREQKEAVRQLVKLKDKKAVPPLIELYKKSKDPEHLRAIASFNDPAAEQVMVDSLDYSEESFDTASIAATALGEIGDKNAVPDLIKAVQKPLPIKTRANVVKLEAMKSLAKMKDPRAVDALIKVLSTSADEQDFYLNKIAAKSLGAFGDARAVPALVRGLFMTGRGADIFQQCRVSLLQIGGDATVDKLIETLQRKNTDVEADAKKYEFFPGIVVQKSAAVLGDLRAKKAVPALLDELKKKDDGLEASKVGKGVAGHTAVLVALGQIGDKSAVKELTGLLSDGKQYYKMRAAAADGLYLMGDTSALPTLATVATKTTWLNAKSHEIDPEAATLVATAITDYTRLADASSPALAMPKLDPELAESDLGLALKAGEARMAVAKECKTDAGCYGKYFADGQDGNKGEKAAFMLARLGKAALPSLQKGIATRDPATRLAVMFALTRTADKSATDVLKALDDQITLDESKPPLRSIVDEMLATRAFLSH